MNKEEILALPIGRKLNMEVYTKVMGGKINTPPDVTVIPNYSEFDDIAFRVVKKMSEKEMPMMLDNNHYLGHFNCGYYTDDVTLIQAEAPTAPEAICKAALLAVMDS